MRRPARLITFLQARLSPEGHLGLHLTLGVLMLIATTWIFGMIAEDVVRGERLALLDVKVSSWLQVHRRPTLTTAMLLLTNVHSNAAISVFTLALAFYLIWRRHLYWLTALIPAVFGGMLLNVLLKNVFDRARPNFEDPLLTFSTYGFPSGHTMAASCFYGFIAAFLVWKIRAWQTRALVVASASVLVMLVGFSRIYLGAHYLSDVLGAMVEGLGWLALCLTAVNTIFRKERSQE